MIVIKDFPNYSVTNIGKVYNNKTNKELAYFDVNGYKYVTLFNKGKKQNKRIHILVYQAYNGHIDKESFVIDHINRDKKDNNSNNLRQVSQLMNLHNQSPYSNNETGIKGISIKSGKYYSSICINYKVHHKYFPCTENGLYRAVMFRILKKIEFRII